MAKRISARPMGTRSLVYPEDGSPRVDLLEKYAGISRDDPARTRIMFALSELAGAYGIDIMKYPEILAKGIEKGRRDYESELRCAEYRIKATEAARQSAARHPRPSAPDRPNACIYYLSVGKLVKIGTTTSLANRVRSYPPDTVVLATEPGSYALEHRRHKQFSPDLAHGREWFHPSADLISHINTLRETPLTAVDLAA